MVIEQQQHCNGSMAVQEATSSENLRVIPAGETAMGKQLAEQLKEQANQKFKEEKYQDAIDLYSKAIEIVGDDAIYYGNRSFAYLKTEMYGAALADATKVR
jgi:serine/threonine-protein phosphatase 5